MDTIAIIEIQDASQEKVQAAWEELQQMPSYVEVMCAEFASEA